MWPCFLEKGSLQLLLGEIYWSNVQDFLFNLESLLCSALFCASLSSLGLESFQLLDFKYPCISNFEYFCLISSNLFFHLLFLRLPWYMYLLDGVGFFFFLFVSPIEILQRIYLQIGRSFDFCIWPSLMLNITGGIFSSISKFFYSQFWLGSLLECMSLCYFLVCSPFCWIR